MFVGGFWRVKLVEECGSRKVKFQGCVVESEVGALGL